MLRETTCKTLPDQSDSGGLLARWGLGIMTGGLLLVLMATLFPFNFHFADALSLPATISHLYGWNLVDWLNNIVLFVPFGLGLSCLMQESRLGIASGFVVVLMISAGLSVTVEILQLFLPTRFSAFADILANTVGGVIGFFLFHLLKAKILTLLLILVSGRQQYFSFNRLTISLFSYFTLACLMTSVMTATSNLDHWDENFTLLVGNEHTGDRPWRGSVSELVIADKAISRAEVERAFSEVNFWHTLGDALIGHYQFSETGSYQDQTGHLPALSWRTSESQGSENDQSVVKDYSSHAKNRSGVFLSSHHWLESEQPAKSMTHSIRSTSQFTLSATVATAEPKQTGPARIISLSGNPYARNFTLGQDQSDLIFRLRTRLNGENGGSPEFSIPNVFADTDAHQIIVVYDGRYFRLYVDTIVNSHSLEMLNVAIMNPKMLFQSLLSRPLNYYFTLDLDAINAPAYKVLYFALIFIPMGSMVGLITLIGKGQAGRRSLLTAGWLVLPVITLEGILASMGGGGMRLENIVLGSIMAMFAMLLFRLWAAAWLFGQSATKRTHA